MNKLENYKKRFFILTESTLGDVKTIESLNPIRKKVFNWAKENGFMTRYVDVSQDRFGPISMNSNTHELNIDKLIHPEKYRTNKTSKEERKKDRKEFQDLIKKVHYDFFKVYDAEDGKGQSAFELSERNLMVYYEAGDDIPYSINTPTKAVLIIETDEYKDIFPSKWQVGLFLCKLHFSENDIKIIKSKFLGLSDSDKFNDKFVLRGQLTTSDVLNLSDYLKTYIWAGPNDINTNQNIT